jgi:hypothetical protein
MAYNLLVGVGLFIEPVYMNVTIHLAQTIRMADTELFEAPENELSHREQVAWQETWEPLMPQV